MMIIEIPGKPQPKQRPRMTRYGAVYTPAETQAFERLVARHAKASGAKPVSGPVQVEITSVFPIPKSWTKKRKAESDGQPHVQRPDLDNLVKCVLDGLNGVAFADDSQVHSVTSRKIWSSECGEGKTVVRVVH
ncbi:RusA family crossover junction endodeoxyribonuclease [Paracoccus versutus]|nr:RusA family crossover junction endodeoxyribonuclease [Paracoccus versutus]